MSRRVEPAPKGAPAVEGLPPFDPLEAGPTREAHATYLRQARRHRPIFAVEPGLLMVTRYEDVRSVLLDPATYSSAGNFTLEGPDVDPEQRLILQFDPPRHTYLRRLELSAFARGSIRDARRWVDERVAHLIEQARERASLEVMSELALPLTTHVIARLVGLAVEDAKELAGWVSDVSAHRPRPVYDLPSWHELSAYLHREVERRAHEPARDDMMSRFCRAADAGELGWEEIPFHVCQLFTAGTETTAYTIGMTLFKLLDDRSRWERWLTEPELFPAIREEGLRYTTAIRIDLRSAATDTEIGGFEVPTGTRLVLSLESANRDETVWSEPDRFGLDRGIDHRHLAFGAGIHQCLGAHLARTEIESVLVALRDRFPTLTLAPGYEPSLVHSSVLNGLERLDVTW